jgi:hypothetical protein
VRTAGETDPGTASNLVVEGDDSVVLEDQRQDRANQLRQRSDPKDRVGLHLRVRIERQRASGAHLPHAADGDARDVTGQRA